MNIKRLLVSIIFSLPLAILLALDLGFSFWPQIPRALILLFWLIFALLLWPTNRKPLKIFVMSLIWLGILGILMPILIFVSNAIGIPPAGTAGNPVGEVLYLALSLYIGVIGIAITIIGLILYLILRKK